MRISLVALALVILVRPTLAQAEILGDVTMSVIVKSFTSEKVVILNEDKEEISLVRSEIQNKKLTTNEINDLKISPEYYEKVLAHYLAGN